MRDRAIDDQPCRDAFLLQLPGRQPRTLQPRPRLGVVDLSDIAQRMRTANDAECRAVATRRERTGIAMREHARTRADQCGAQRAHLQILLRSEEHTSELQSLMRISYA